MYIKRVPLAAEPIGDGANGSEIEMIFGENYYQLHEIFKVEETGQQFFVTSRPTRKADNAWSVMVRIIDEDYSSTLEPCHKGYSTRFIGDCIADIKVN